MGGEWRVEGGGRRAEGGVVEGGGWVEGGWRVEGYSRKDMYEAWGQEWRGFFHVKQHGKHRWSLEATPPSTPFRFSGRGLGACEGVTTRETHAALP